MELYSVIKKNNTHNEDRVAVSIAIDNSGQLRLNYIIKMKITMVRYT